MCTHFIHQCAAAQNDGNAKTNDDVCLSLRERVSWRIGSAGRWKKPCPFLVCDERVSTTIDKVTWQIHSGGHKVQLVK